METTYITFGQNHKHIIGDRTYDRDCIATISCANASEGRQLTVDIFGDKFCTTYHEEDLPEDALRHFPRGYLAVVLPKKESIDPADQMGELSLEYHKDLVDLRREYMRKLSKILGREDGKVSMGDISKMELSASKVELSTSLLETIMLIESAGNQINKPEIAEDAIAAIVAQQVDSWTSEIMPELLGVRMTTCVLERLMENKLRDMDIKTEH